MQFPRTPGITLLASLALPPCTLPPEGGNRARDAPPGTKRRGRPRGELRAQARLARTFSGESSGHPPGTRVWQLEEKQRIEAQHKALKKNVRHKALPRHMFRSQGPWHVSQCRAGCSAFEGSSRRRKKGKLEAAGKEGCRVKVRADNPIKTAQRRHRAAGRLHGGRLAGRDFLNLSKYYGSILLFSI